MPAVSGSIVVVGLVTESLADALATLEAAVATADPAALPALAGAFEALRARCVARLATPAVVTPRPEVDELLDVDAAAAVIGRSPSWLRKNGHAVPGFAQPGGRGTRARWSRRALTAWAFPASGAC